MAAQRFYIDSWTTAHRSPRADIVGVSHVMCGEGHRSSPLGHPRLIVTTMHEVLLYTLDGKGGACTRSWSLRAGKGFALTAAAVQHPVSGHYCCIQDKTKLRLWSDADTDLSSAAQDRAGLKPPRPLMHEAVRVHAHESLRGFLIVLANSGVAIVDPDKHVNQVITMLGHEPPAGRRVVWCALESTATGR